MTQARENFARHLSMYDPEEPRDNEFAKDSPAETRAKLTAIEAFDAMFGDVDPSARAKRWQRVYDAESELAHELHRKVREHEARFENRKNA